MNWYLKVLRNYFGFSGRARRKEYWMFVLFNIIVSIVLLFADSMLGTMDAQSGWGVLSGIYSLLVLIPSLAVSVRRLHDLDRSGWWLLLALVPLIGGIVLLIWFCMDGTQGDNRFGPSPKAGEGGVPAMA